MGILSTQASYTLIYVAFVSLLISHTLLLSLPTVLEAFAILRLISALRDTFANIIEPWYGRAQLIGNGDEISPSKLITPFLPVYLL